MKPNEIPTKESVFASDVDKHLINFDTLQAILTKEDGQFPTQQSFYYEEINDTVAFAGIIGIERGRNDQIRTDLRFRLYDLANKKGLGDLVFSTYPKSQHYHLRHREVDTGNLGISGSDMLKKAESVIQTLIETGVLPEKPLSIEAGQVGVIDWALRNGYQFLSEEKQKLYESIKAGHSDYATNVTITTEDGWQRHGYIFTREKADWARKTISGTGGSAEDITLQAVRFELIKSINPDAVS